MIKGKLYLVSTPIGNLGDITFRAIETLKHVDYVVCEDTRVTKRLLNHYDISKPCISFHSKSSPSVAKKIIGLLNEGKNLALVSDSGTPLISDPGCILTKEAVNQGIEVYPIPGPSAVHSALVASGFCISSYSFYGFISPKSGKRKTIFKKLKNENNIIVFYESPHRIINFLKDLYDVFGNIDVSVSKEMTKIHEKTYRGKLDNVLKKIVSDGVKGEYTIVVNNRQGRSQSK